MLHTPCHLVSTTQNRPIHRSTILTSRNLDRGQGLNHAIQDAYNLVNILIDHHNSSSATSDLASRLQSYAQEVCIRGSEEARLSKQNAYMVLDWKVLEQSPVFKHALDRSPVDDTEHAETEDSGTAKRVEKEITAMAGA